MCLRAIQRLLNHWWDWLDFGTKLLFDSIQIESILVCYQVNCKTQMPESPRTSDSMQICLGVLWEIKVDHHIDCLNVNSTGEQVRTDQVPTVTITEVMEHPVSVGLKHFRVNIKTRVPKLCNFLGKQLYSVDRVAEDNALVD